jgi:hypothetical protein
MVLYSLSNTTFLRLIKIIAFGNTTQSQAQQTKIIQNSYIPKTSLYLRVIK